MSPKPNCLVCGEKLKTRPDYAKDVVYFKCEKGCMWGHVTGEDFVSEGSYFNQLMGI